jgi:two-component system, NarL family, sensor histidine kinase UhpB
MGNAVSSANLTTVPASDVAPAGSLARRDLIIVALITLATGGLAILFEISERVYAATRRWESLQLDEVPPMLFALALCLAWFAWRRYREANAAVEVRRAIEAQLITLLDDNRRLAQQYLQVQEAERKSLARELHDELGQYLNAIKTDAVTIQVRTGEKETAVVRASSAIIEHADHVHAIVRDLIRKLRPVALDDLGLRAAIEHYLEHAQQRLPQVKLDVSMDEGIDALDEQLSLAIYRLLQEAVTNAAKHAGATQITLRVKRQNAGQTRDEIQCSIVDNGRGSSPDEMNRGLGLIGMRERVEMLGGTLRIETQPGRGFGIHVTIPAGATS